MLFSAYIKSVFYHIKMPYFVFFTCLRTISMEYKKKKTRKLQYMNTWVITSATFSTHLLVLQTETVEKYSLPGSILCLNLNSHFDFCSVEHFTEKIHLCVPIVIWMKGCGLLALFFFNYSLKFFIRRFNVIGYIKLCYVHGCHPEV